MAYLISCLINIYTTANADQAPPIHKVPSIGANLRGESQYKIKISEHCTYCVVVVFVVYFNCCFWEVVIVFVENHIFGGKSLLKAQKVFKVSKGAKIRNRCNQVPHLNQDTNGKVINLQLDTTNESPEVSHILIYIKPLSISSSL